MCLYISDKHHPLINSSFGSSQKQIRKPIVLTKPITVWKILNVYGSNLRSPYRNMPYQFGKLNSLTEDEITLNFPLHGIRNHKVTVGLHAKIGTRRYAREHCGAWTTDSRCFPALIPTGSRVFIGDNNDIASTHMIVFKDVKSVLAHCGVDALAPPVKRDNLAEYNKS